MMLFIPSIYCDYRKRLSTPVFVSASFYTIIAILYYKLFTLLYLWKCDFIDWLMWSIIVQNGQIPDFYYNFILQGTIKSKILSNNTFSLSPYSPAVSNPSTTYISWSVFDHNLRKRKRQTIFHSFRYLKERNMSSKTTMRLELTGRQFYSSPHKTTSELSMR